MEETIKIMPPGPLYLAREGYPFIISSFLLSLIGAWIFWPLGLAMGIFFLFTLYFFRDPERSPPGDPELMLSPADGTVLKVELMDSGPNYPGPHQKISIFMSALNVHVNRIPYDGEIQEVHYHPGKFFVASLDKASEQNERNTVVMTTPRGERVSFTQIAGLVARRIVCYLQPGRRVRRGERYGMIRFGSRMEVSIPKDWDVLVSKGQKVRGVTTALAKRKSREQVA